MKTLLYRLMLLLLLPAFLLAMIAAGIFEGYVGAKHLYRNLWREAGDV